MNCCSDEQYNYPCKWCGRFKNGKTIYADNHNQRCFNCFILLKTIGDWIGGGSHYWNLECPKCYQEYSWDSYEFELKKKNYCRCGGIALSHSSLCATCFTKRKENGGASFHIKLKQE